MRLGSITVIPCMDFVHRQVMDSWVSYLCKYQFLCFCCAWTVITLAADRHDATSACVSGCPAWLDETVKCGLSAVKTQSPDKIKKREMSWTLNKSQQRSRAGRWSWALKQSYTAFCFEFSQQRCYTRSPCDSAPHSS